MRGDTTLILHFAKVIYVEDRRGERNWNRPLESIIRKSKKSGITDFLSMNSPCGQGSCPLGGVAARRQSEDALWRCIVWRQLQSVAPWRAPRVWRLWLQSGQGAHGGRTPQHGTTLDTCSQPSSLKCLRAVRRINRLN